MSPDPDGSHACYQKEHSLVRDPGSSMQGDRGKPTDCFTWPEKAGGWAHKPQAPSLTSRILNDKVKTMNEKQLKRIADAIEEILRLIKKDMREIKKAAK